MSSPIPLASFFPPPPPPPGVDYLSNHQSTNHTKLSSSSDQHQSTIRSNQRLTLEPDQSTHQTTMINATTKSIKSTTNATNAPTYQIPVCLPRRGLFPPPACGTRRPAVPRHHPDPLRRRRSPGALPCAAAGLAVELLDLSGKLRGASSL